jgi:excisionase family DNA binding protein
LIVVVAVGTNDRMLTVRDVAERLRISPSKAYELTAKGKIAFYKVDGAIRVSEEQLAAYLASVERPTTPAASPRRAAAPDEYAETRPSRRATRVHLF